MDERLQTPVTPLSILPGSTVAQLVAQMAGTSFQARSLAQGAQIWAEMLKDRATIFLGLAGAMVPAGMRRVVAYLIEHRLIDCLVSTGANLYHDLHETLGLHHWQGTPQVDDERLREDHIDRIYDVLVSDDELDEADDLVVRFAQGLGQGKAYTTREFLFLLGESLRERGMREEGILTAAAKARIPIYCPAIGDSGFGLAIAAGRAQGSNRLVFDAVQDVAETVRLCLESPATGVILVGGGTPKNFIQQAQAGAYILGEKPKGHRYAVQITTDSPHWGGLSGATFEEARSWGKIAPEASTTTIYCDATIALPILVTALAQSEAEAIAQRQKPSFGLGEELTFQP